MTTPRENSKARELPSRYDPSTSEEILVERWIDAGCFTRTRGRGDHPLDCTIVIPPPNVTGILHMGHALDDTIQDTFIRFNRMAGRSVRWILGLDHAGISTQTKVDKKLKEEGVSRLEIGREKFIEACWNWTHEYGGTIVKQIKRMGGSCDYSDQKFTMDADFSYAVRKVFCDWFHEGLIYRGKRIVNWCPSCKTAISDDEAEYKEEKGHLWYLRYPLKEPVDGAAFVTVATTRPETMLGDAGVAISPDDPDKKKFEGATVVLPIVGREIPIFSDWHVDAAYGTGFVKVTPAHDPNDFAMGEAHHFEKINVFDEAAHVVDGYGDLSGLDRDTAREKIVEIFEEEGLLDHVEEIEHSVMHCYRCGTALEPWLSEQWFVKMDELKKPATKAVQDKTVAFHPKRWEDTYLTWMENLKDWCISRQLWWGHRIPVFTCEECGWEDALMDDISTCPQCGSQKVIQDPDVLDTWFSSQLFPFATQGWPQHPESLKGHYPTKALFTARDIIALWVARMMMSSYRFLDQQPFDDVFIHATILAKDGSRMSKSKGNGVDPMKLIEMYGADAMRFNLLTLVTGNQDVKFDAEFDRKTGKFLESPRTAAARGFVTKIWNACRFALMNLDGYVPGPPEAQTPEDKWMLSRLSSVVESATDQLSTYAFGDYAKDMQNFFWNEICDWYIELTKGRLVDADKKVCQAAQRNLVFVLDAVLRLLHPVMPFVTETIWEKLPVSSLDLMDEAAGREDAAPLVNEGERLAAKISNGPAAEGPHASRNHESRFLMQAPWPEKKDFAVFKDDAAEKTFDVARRLISGVRSTRSRYALSPNQELEVTVSGNEQVARILEDQTDFIKNVGKVSVLNIATKTDQKPKECVVLEDKDFTAFVLLAGLVDFEKEKAHLEKDLQEAEKEMAGLQKTVANEGFLAKAAPEIVEKKRARVKELEDAIARLRKQIADL